MRPLLFIFLNVIFFQSALYGQDTAIDSPDSSKAVDNNLRVNGGASKIIVRAAPVLLLSYGLMSLENKPVRFLDKQISHELMESNPGFSTHLDDKLRYAPIVAVYSMNFLGIKGRSDFFDRTAIYMMSNIIMSKSVDFLKDKSHRLRPSQGDFRSFPSGHTAIAFGAAEFMRLEYKDRSPWYGYAAYSVAAATGAIRMLKNEHYVSDVLAGAGVGILSTKASYLLYPWLKKKILGQKDLKFQAMPFIQRGAVGYTVIAPLN